MQLKHQPPETLKQTPHIVAFLDFLGASEKMRDPKQCHSFLQVMHYIYAANIDSMEDMHTNYGKPRLKIKIFSDNIVIALDIKTPKIRFEDFLYIARSATFFQTHALMNQIPVRGAITFGELYIDDIFVYGNALVKAHEMESQQAIYPRVIVDNIFFPDTSLPEKIKTVKEITFSQDTDGEWFINFIEPINSILDKKQCRASIVQIRSTIINLFEQYKSNAKLKQKYYWLVHKFNYLCDVSKFEKHKIILNHNNEPDISAIYDDIAGVKHE